MDAHFSEGWSLLTSGSRKDMSTSRPQGPGNLLESGRSIENMLKHILRDNKVESLIRKCLLFKVLATITGAGVNVSEP